MNIQNEIITIVDLSTIVEWTFSMSLLLLGIINIIKNKKLLTVYLMLYKPNL